MSRFGRLREWFAAHQMRADAGIAAGLVVLSIPGLITGPVPEGYRDPDLWVWLLVVLQAGPLAWRRRSPTVVLAVTFGALCVALLAGYFVQVASFGSIVALYTVAAYTPRRRAVVAAAATALALGAVVPVVVLTRPDLELSVGEALANFLTVAVVWFIGDNVRSRRQWIQVLEDRAALLERERTEHARWAVADERSRIARELHDVVAHGMSVMVVQAGAARRILDTDPDGARGAMEAIETVGRESLDEMRRLLGLLRRDDSSSFGRVPQPGLAHLDLLIDQCREAGVPVDLEIDGDPAALPTGIDLTAYRIVQESLTNVLKHAGNARVSVRLCYFQHMIEVSVTDDGRGLVEGTDQPDAGHGHGLIGLHERVTLYGGDLRVGNRDGGGFAVRARLPLEPRP